MSIFTAISASYSLLPHLHRLGGTSLLFHPVSGLSPLEYAIKLNNKSAVTELLKFSASITPLARKLSTGNSELTALLDACVAGRKKANKAVRAAKTPFQAVREPQLFWTGGGFKAKADDKTAAWKGWIRVYRHRNYIASPSMRKVNEMCRRGS
jgi:hypothetical protein